MSIDRTLNVHVSLYLCTDEGLMSYLVQYWGVLCVVQVGYGLGKKKTVLVSGVSLCCEATQMHA